LDVESVSRSHPIQFTAIPQEFEEKAGTIGLALPHGRDEKEIP
jgi:hypothetical protein